MTCTLVQGVTLLDMLMVCSAIPKDEQDQFEAFAGMDYDYEFAAMHWYQTPGPKWTIVAYGRPIVVAGFTALRPGVWQDWLFSTPLAWEGYWRSVTKFSKRVMDEMLQGGAHRLQCVSLASRIQAHKWYGALGLGLEGTLRGYGARGEDALMFSRLRVDNG